MKMYQEDVPTYSLKLNLVQKKKKKKKDINKKKCE